ncbi:MAG TPA: SDR family oxidoreductase [Stellaceae bacterium]|nr:SDR family oxidoreductase [Stellaceae bacterium]
MAERPLPVFITGASRGIGAATARHFARGGHPVALVARTASALEALAKEINDAGGKAVAIPCDVADAEAVKRAVERAVAALGGLGIVVNDAGTLAPVGPLVDTPPAEWARAIAINLCGPMHVMHYAIPHLLRGGVVINITSGAAQAPIYGWTTYCASKAALMITSRIVQIEEGKKRGIRVVALSPGMVDTEMYAYNRAHRDGREPSDGTEDLRPPAEVAQIIAWVASAGADECAGKVVSARDPDFRRRAGVPPLADSR